jgi:putative transposase
VDEIKSVPGNPVSHPFIERVIGTTRREYLDHLLFFNERDLQNKLDKFQAYYNDVRAHSSLDMKTLRAMALGVEPDEKVVSIDRYRWKKHCNGLYELPVAA